MWGASPALGQAFQRIRSHNFLVEITGVERITENSFMKPLEFGNRKRVRQKVA